MICFYSQDISPPVRQMVTSRIWQAQSDVWLFHWKKEIALGVKEVYTLQKEYACITASCSAIVNNKKRIIRLYSRVAVTGQMQKYKNGVMRV